MRNGELHGCYFWPYIAMTNNGRRDGRGIWRVWDESTYRDLVGKSPDRTPFRRPRHRCTENIKIYRNGIGYEKVGRTDQDQGTNNQRDIVKPLINLQLPGHLLSEKRSASQETFCPMQ